MEFFLLDPEELFHRFGESVDYMPDGQQSDDAGGAASLVGGLSKIKNAAARIANYATYYQMKSRAGTVGRIGIAQTLDRLRERYPALPVHLVGHSFGARAVVSAGRNSCVPGGALSRCCCSRRLFRIMLLLRNSMVNETVLFEPYCRTTARPGLLSSRIPRMIGLLGSPIRWPHGLRKIFQPP